jgi:hypothetical protein
MHALYMKRKETSATGATIGQVACAKLSLNIGQPSMMHGLGHQ